MVSIIFITLIVDFGADFGKTTTLLFSRNQEIWTFCGKDLTIFVDGDEVFSTVDDGAETQGLVYDEAYEGLIDPAKHAENRRFSGYNDSYTIMYRHGVVREELDSGDLFEHRPDSLPRALTQAIHWCVDGSPIGLRKSRFVDEIFAELSTENPQELILAMPMIPRINDPSGFEKAFGRRLNKFIAWANQ